MARTPEEGLKYFPLDCDFFNNNKIRILKRRYGADGIVVYLYMLSEVYRWKGYYLEIGNDYYELVAEELKMSLKKIMQIMGFLFSRSLLTKVKLAGKLVKSDTAITSRGIQEQYQKSTKSRGKNRKIIVRSDIWLLSEKSTMSHIKVDYNRINSELIPINYEEIAINPGWNPQSKVNKSIDEEDETGVGRRIASLLLEEFLEEVNVTQDEMDCLLIYSEYFKPEDFGEFHDMLKICRTVGNCEYVVSALDITFQTLGVEKPLGYILKVAKDIKTYPGKYREAYEA